MSTILPVPIMVFKRLKGMVLLWVHSRSSSGFGDVDPLNVKESCKNYIEIMRSFGGEEVIEYMWFRKRRLKSWEKIIAVNAVQNYQRALLAKVRGQLLREVHGVDIQTNLVLIVMVLGSSVQDMVMIMDRSEI